jgi:hypothetical protein
MILTWIKDSPSGIGHMPPGMSQVQPTGGLQLNPYLVVDTKGHLLLSTLGPPLAVCRSPQAPGPFPSAACWNLAATSDDQLA